MIWKKLSLLFVFAFFVRVVGISSYPIGFTQDEAGLGYDAYSILKTGKDQWGKVLPLTFRSFGDFKQPLYVYLTIPSVYLFGLNVFAVRLPSAFFGSLSVLIVYLLVRELFKSPTFALLSALMLALSPWHISLSRGAFEANLVTFFIPLGIWAFTKGIKDAKFAWISSFVFGISLFSYHSARLYTPFLGILLIVFFRRELTHSNKFSYSNLLGLISKFKWQIFLLLIFFTAAVFTNFIGAGRRGIDVSIINPTDKWEALKDRRYESVVEGLPDSISRIFSNKVTYVGGQFVRNYINYLSANFLFLDGAGSYSYGMVHGRGVLYSFEILTLLIAIIWIVKRKSSRSLTFILIWLITAPIPAALSKSNGAAGNRASLMMPSIQILSAFGLYIVFQWLSFLKNSFLRFSGYFLTVFIVFIFTAFFIEDYIFHTPVKAAPSMQYGIEEIFDYINENGGKYDRIFLSKRLGVPNIWVAFYQKWDPIDYQMATKDWRRYEAEGRDYLDQLEHYSLGKYNFGSVDVGKLRETPNTLVIGEPREFHLSQEAIKTIYYPNGTVAYKIVESSSLLP